MDYSSLWDARIFADLFLGGIGVGAFLFLAFALGDKGARAEKTFKIGGIAVFAFVAAGALCLLSELGKPLAFMNTIAGFNATSVTSWGGPLQMLFLVSVAVLVALLFARGGRAAEGVAFKVVGAVGIVLAAFLLAYHGLVLNAAGRGLWADALIVPLFAVSSLLAGGAVALLVDKLASKAAEDAAAFKALAGTSLALVVLLCAFGFTVAPAGADAVFCYQAVMADSAALWWIGACVVGALAPLAIAALALAKPAFRNIAPIAATAACALIGSFALKYLVAAAAQIVIG